jgi:LysR family glycine cleavage system transcriptional activator
LNALRAFEAAARNLSFKAAAEELGVTPAALSYQIRNLEDLLAVALFDRHNRAVSLTPAAERIFPGVHDGFQRLTQAVDELDKPDDENVLVISVGPAFAAKWLTPRLTRFLEQHPDIDPRISAVLRKADFDLEQIDAAVRFGYGNFPGLVTTKLLQETVTPMCSPDLLKGRLPLNTPADLARHALIHDDSLLPFEGAPGWADWLTAAGVDGVDVSRGLHFNHADLALDSAIGGTGIVLGRSVLAARDLQLGRLVCPFDIELPVTPAFYLVYPHKLPERPKIAAFRHWLMEEINNHS